MQRQKRRHGLLMKKHYAEAEAALEKKHEEMLAAGEEIPEDEEVTVDMSGFEATPEMLENRKKQRQPIQM